MAEGLQSLITHLTELRDRLLRSVLAVLVLMLCLAPFANKLYTLMAGPLLTYLPEGGSLIATKVTGPFLVPFKLAMVTALFLAMPFLLYQVWAFVAPGLYAHEQRLARPLLISSTTLFYLGGCFAYFVIIPLVTRFVIAWAPEGVAVMPDIGEYLDFVLALFFAFGLAFQVPVATVLLVVSGIVTPDRLVQARPYVIVGAFGVGMMLTPPDVISQTLLALPMWLLFELGIIFSRLVKRQMGERAESEASEDEERDPTDDEMEAELDRLEEEDDDDDEEARAREAADQLDRKRLGAP